MSFLSCIPSKSTLPPKNSPTDSTGGLRRILPKEKPFLRKIGDAYRHSILDLVNALQSKDFFVTSLVVGTLLTEPLEALKAAALSFSMLKKRFNYYGMNPVTLTPEQLKRNPVLLIHGNYHNQSAWIPLAKELQKNNLGPIYTVNLPSGKITQKDIEIIEKKIEQIKMQYKQHNIDDIKIDLVGHSRGSTLAQMRTWWMYEDKGNEYTLRWKLHNDIRKIITLGTVVEYHDYVKSGDSNCNDRIHEITGQYDILAKDARSAFKKKKIINAGHLGLLYSQKTHSQIVEWLKI